MNHTIFQQKLNSLKTFPNLDTAAIDKFGEVVQNFSNLQLHRMNPLSFAQDYGFELSAILDIFIHGVKIGLLDFDWNMFCPACGGISSSHSSIDNITKNKYLCSTCDVYIDTDLSDYVEVAFNFPPSIHNLKFDPFQSFKSYREFYITKNFEYPKEIVEYITKSLLKFQPLSINEACSITLEAKPNELFRLSSIDNHSLVNIYTGSETIDDHQTLDIDILSTGFSPGEFRIPAGKFTVNVHNHLNRTTAFFLFKKNKAASEKLFKENPPKIHPFLSGKMLLNNQTFRDLFHIQSLPTDLQLKVSNITILFTDLKSSTELYEKKGDISAYNIVQKHFELLKAATREFSGAIIKTIGDAVMASFSTPSEGVSAAIDMLEKIKLMNQVKDEHEVAIKVGLHSGNALAVCANETLDYFGQTVNLAARVQGLAEGGEICMTTPVYITDNVQQSLSSNKYFVEKISSQLKGISIPTTVYKCRSEEKYYDSI